MNVNPSGHEWQKFSSIQWQRACESNVLKIENRGEPGIVRREKGI